MDATQTENESEARDSTSDIIENSFSLGDRLRLQPLQHPLELGLLEREPRQDGVTERDARPTGLPGLATLRPIVVALHPGALQLHDEVVLADLGVVVVDPVTPGILAAQLLAEPDQVEGFEIELAGL